MRLVCISDTHAGAYPDLPPGDVLVHCGDEDLRETQDVYRLISWMDHLPFKYRIFVPGNHDLVPDLTSCFKVMARRPTTVCLLDSWVDIPRDMLAPVPLHTMKQENMVRIYGSPWTPLFMDWAYMRPDEELATYWDNIPSNVDILLTHGPAFDILDKNSDGIHCGSKTLAAAIQQRIHPAYHIFGHIHEAGGKEQEVLGTRHINASLVDARYEAVFAPRVFDI